MKKVLLLVAIQVISIISFSQNVGIGEATPTDTKLQIKRSDSALLLLHNPSFGGDVKTGMYFKSGNAYSGAIVTTGNTAASAFRMGFSTFGSPSPSGLIERISITDIGNVGIGTITPTAKLEVNGSFKLSGGSPGAGKFLMSDASGLASWYDASASFLPGGANGNTLRHNGTSWLTNSTLYNNGSSIGIGTTSPSYILDVNGRMRLRHNGVTSGLWFNSSTNVETSFIGQYTDNRWGVFAGGTWKFAMDGNDGTVYIGSTNLDAETLTNAAGYKLKVFGKIIGEEVRVQLKSAWPDYVFENDYKRLSIDELERFITVNKHLPNVPSAAEVETKGQELGEMQRKMMEKIEELSLYIIDLKKEIDLLKKNNAR